MFKKNYQYIIEEHRWFYLNCEIDHEEHAL